MYMKNLNFINTLNQTLNRLTANNDRLLKEIEKVQMYNELDPEKSPIHDLWHIYRVQLEFKEYIEGLLQNRMMVNTAS